MTLNTVGRGFPPYNACRSPHHHQKKDNVGGCSRYRSLFARAFHPITVTSLGNTYAHVASGEVTRARNLALGAYRAMRFAAAGIVSKVANLHDIVDVQRFAKVLRSCYSGYFCNMWRGFQQPTLPQQPPVITCDVPNVVCIHTFLEI